jgi:hypothetical protein
MEDELIYVAAFAGAGMVIKGIYSFIRETVDTYRMNREIKQILAHLNETEDYTIDRVVFVSRIVQGLKLTHKRPCGLSITVMDSAGAKHRISLTSE